MKRNFIIVLLITLTSCGLFKKASKRSSTEKKSSLEKTVTYNLSDNSGMIKIPLELPPSRSYNQKDFVTTIRKTGKDSEIISETDTVGETSFNQDLFWASYDPSRRSSFIITRSNGTFGCISEVQPDAAIEISKNFSGDLSAVIKAGQSSDVNINGDLKAVSSTIEKIAQLGARNPSNYLLRDALYRLNELSFNGALKYGSEVGIFNNIIDSITVIAKTEAITQAQVEIEVQKTLQLKYQLQIDSIKADTSNKH